MNYRTIRDIKLTGKTVLVRVDYNVPLENGKITNNFRIRASLPTLEFLRSHGAKRIILISHLGRPEGRNKTFSLKLVADALSKMLPQVNFVDDVSGPDVESAVKKLPAGGILLLENLRFYAGEEKNSSEFMREIVDSTSADFFVQDGFAVVHRLHASVSAISEHLPVYAGLLLESELVNLKKILENPARPLTFIVGGFKVDDKSPLIEKFSKLADHVLIGGKIAADGFHSKNPKTYIAEDFDEDAAYNKLDIGPLSTAKFVDTINGSKTVIWNGLLGKAEDPAYATSSTIVAETIGKLDNALTVVCGGDTTGFVEQLMCKSKHLNFSLISTGGGAALEFLSGKSLPGLEVIELK